MKSELCIWHRKSGDVTVVLQSDDLIEAPNWTPDGAALLVNGGGGLFRVALDAPVPEAVPVDTGFARKLNNDHGISPDGRLLAISDATEHGESCIYTLDAKGGTPRQVTEKTPSYWHGWSPDGDRLAYVGKRDGVFNVYTIAQRGGAETCLTDGFDHTDGPDYTPDGAWIWFNGERAGRMQLWRMHPDGSALEQMTEETGQNWFPHPSPDGAHVLYLAYGPDVTGHPRDKDVALRLMPAAGGESETVVTLFGGQGSINVPCWAPDGSAFAFMRYARPEPQ